MPNVAPAKSRAVDDAWVASNTEYASIAHLYQANNADLVNFARKFRLPAGMAEDLVQDTWVHFLADAPKQFTSAAPTSSVRGYLFTICRNLSVNQTRKEKRSAQRNLRRFYDGTDDSAELAMLRNFHENAMSEYLEAFSAPVAAALATLTPKSRTILIQALVEDLSRKEIAELLEIEIGTVWSRRSRAAKQMVQALQHTDIAAEVHRYKGPAPRPSAARPSMSSMDQLTCEVISAIRSLSSEERRLLIGRNTKTNGDIADELSANQAAGDAPIEKEMVARWVYEAKRHLQTALAAAHQPPEGDPNVDTSVRIVRPAYKKKPGAAKQTTRPAPLPQLPSFRPPMTPASSRVRETTSGRAC